MIRQATKYDKTQIIEMMKCFRKESPYQEIDDNEEYWNELLNNIFAGQGAVFLDDNKGLLMCLIIPNIWNPKVLGLHELAWYVYPEFRKTFTGYRLLTAYLDYAKKQKQNKRINYFTISKLSNSPDINYSRYGFIKKDENWVQ